MSYVRDFLEECKKNLGEWTCSYHSSKSTMPAGVFREAKKLGYIFEEVTPNRWATRKFCPVCGQYTMHYKLLEPEPTLTRQVRLTIDKKSRDRTLSILGGRDAFSGASISSTPEIDHKVPWTRLEEDIDIRNLSDEEIKENFQLLTREHNLLKDRMCGICKTKGIRPPFFEIEYWYQGDEHYNGSCKGCGWHDGVEWRKSINKCIKGYNMNNKLIKTDEKGAF